MKKGERVVFFWEEEGKRSSRGRGGKRTEQTTPKKKSQKKKKKKTSFTRLNGLKFHHIAWYGRVKFRVDSIRCTNRQREWKFRIVPHRHMDIEPSVWYHWKIDNAWSLVIIFFFVLKLKKINKELWVGVCVCGFLCVFSCTLFFLFLPSISSLHSYFGFSASISVCIPRIVSVAVEESSVLMVRRAPNANWNPYTFALRVCFTLFFFFFWKNKETDLWHFFCYFWVVWGKIWATPKVANAAIHIFILPRYSCTRYSSRLILQ